MILRDAELTDRQFFFDLRNDPDVIKFSYTKQGVAWDQHCRWWADTWDHLLVAVEGERRLGTVRLTPLDDACCEVHYALVAADRGRGWAAKVLEEAERVARELGYAHIVARVDTPNTPSIRAFLRSGYSVSSPGTLMFERDIA